MYKHNGVYGIVYVAIACISKSCVFTYVIKWYYIRYTFIELVQGNMMKRLCQKLEILFLYVVQKPFVTEVVFCYILFETNTALFV